MLGFGYACTGYVGGLDVLSPGNTEPLLGYHAGVAGFLTIAIIW